MEHMKLINQVRKSLKNADFNHSKGIQPPLSSLI